MNGVWWLLAAGIVAGACSAGSKGVDDVVCTMEARPGINLTAIDSVGGQPISTAGVAVAEEGSYSDKAIALPGTPVRYSMAYERAGTYTVTVAVDGYQSWRATGVVVRRDVCHVITVQLTARLVR